MLSRYVLLALLVVIAPVLAQGATISRDGEWRVVTYEDGGELRYIPPQVTEADYPPGALRTDAEGRTVVALHVDAQGRVTRCETAETSGLAELDERACEIYRERGRFELRNLPDGKTLRAPVVWKLLDPAPTDEG